MGWIALPCWRFGRMVCFKGRGEKRWMLDKTNSCSGRCVQVIEWRKIRKRKRQSWSGGDWIGGVELM